MRANASDSGRPQDADTANRRERLHVISEADARAKGCEDLAGFRLLWDSIHAKNHLDNSWIANPWVWVIEFRVVQPQLQTAKGT